jgi:hypothetical protein
MDITHEFERLQPWVTKFRINGKEYGGYFDAMNDVRISQFFDYFPNAQTIMELGSLEGGHSFGLASHATVERILAIEGRAANIEKSLLVQNLIGDHKVQFVETDLQTADLTIFGQFDAVFCSGLLYHLAEPWKLIDRCVKVSPNLFIWTHYADEKAAKKIVNGFRGRWYREGGLLDPLSGLSKKSFWPTLGSLINMLTGSGLRTIYLIENNSEHPHGAAVTLAATVGSPRGAALATRPPSSPA